MRINLMIVATGVLAATALVALAAALPGSLPLRHGRYVEVSAECDSASSSASSWFGGGYVPQSPHAHCEAVRVVREAGDRFRVAARCFETSDRRQVFEVVDHIRVIGHQQYEVENRFGRTRARWCPA